MKILAERIKDLPEGTKFYSPCYGEVEFVKTTSNGITCRDEGGWEQGFFADGSIHKYGECMLFPSKDNRDWDKFISDCNKFDINTLQPFDKVLVRDSNGKRWEINFFDHYDRNNLYPYFALRSNWNQCVPYNEDTKHLLGNSKQAPEYYVTWEK